MERCQALQHSFSGSRGTARAITSKLFYPFFFYRDELVLLFEKKRGKLTKCNVNTVFTSDVCLHLK